MNIDRIAILLSILFAIIFLVACDPPKKKEPAGLIPIPMKYCKLDCINFMLKTSHNSASGLLSSGASSASSETVYSFVSQYCTNFIKNETVCSEKTYGSGNHRLIYSPFHHARGFPK